MEFACLDLINSEQWDGFGRRTDHLENSTWIKRFLTEWGFEAGLEPEQLDLNRLVELRTLLRRMVKDIAGRGQPSDEDIAALNAVLGAEPVRRRLVRQDDSYQVELVPPIFSQYTLLAEIAASLAELLAQHNWRRVKVCANDGCRWAFYDETRGNTRRWCSDLTCGNRDKVRRFRARQKKRQAKA
jgi:predicted RNA-binding Zn ribbon-like protein